MKRGLVVPCGTRDPAAGQMACSEPQANRKDPDAHYDSLILFSHGARVLHARIVVGILVGVHVRIVVVLSQASAFSPFGSRPSGPGDAASSRCRLSFSSVGDGFGLFSSARPASR